MGRGSPALRKWQEIEGELGQFFLGDEQGGGSSDGSRGGSRGGGTLGVQNLVPDSRSSQILNCTREVDAKN